MKGYSKAFEKIVVVGYGSQGRAIALNLRDSGYKVTVALQSGSRSRRQANDDGFKPIRAVAASVRDADCVCFAFPDHLHGRVYQKEIRGNLPESSTLLFLHGLSIHFGHVQPAPSHDVILIAPHAPGREVRTKYLGDRSLSAFYAVHQDCSKRARRNVIELAGAVGFSKKRLVATTFEHEVIGDLFGEQAVLCGGLAALIKSGFEVLIENGIPPDHAYLEVAYQLDLIIALIKDHGIEGMLRRVSVAARMGALNAGPQIIDASAKKRMERLYRRIESGNFAKRLVSLSPKEIASLDKAVGNLSHPKFEKAARKFSKKK